MIEWGWRIPFIASSLIMLFAVWLRRNLKESPVFEGRAELVTEGDQLAEAATATRAKYGLAAGITRAVDWAWEVAGTKSPDGLVVIHIVG